MAGTKSRKNRISPLPLILLMGGVIALWAIYGVVVMAIPFGGDQWEFRGKFGDMFGAFNALFTAGAFAALIYEIRLEYKAIRREELHATLSAQLDTLVQLYALPAEQRGPVWQAVLSGIGCEEQDFPIETAIANQIRYIEELMAGEDLDFVPTYGRHPGEKRLTVE
jgi:hypothetical protein